MTVTASLARWVADLDALGYVDVFPGTRIARRLEPVRDRFDDYYISLITELFDMMRRGQGTTDPDDWALLGNALTDIATRERADMSAAAGVSTDDARLFGATAFHFGGFPASAYFVAQGMARDRDRVEDEQACFELLARPAALTSTTAIRLTTAIRTGNLAAIDDLRREATEHATAAFWLGPTEWIPAALRMRLLDRLAERNVRSALPEGSAESWNQLVASFLARRPPVWEFFPSQLQAIQAGLLSSTETFSLQMPTGAGKTALTETLLFHHARVDAGSAAVMIVPYRSLASELRTSLVRRLTAMGITARSLYGGSVPAADEAFELDTLTVLVSTPETLSGLIGANEAFYRRISLVVCDEGHLLDSESRGVALELLLARLKARQDPPRFVFVSAIVPNVEEINSWLGGRPDTVVVSDYRPALAEFAMLHESTATGGSIDLVMHPEADVPTRFSLHGFLSGADFLWENPRTDRPNTYPWRTIKTRSVATARKLMGLGPVAVFAANKGGDQGAIGLAQELVEQLDHPLSLPRPIDHAVPEKLDPVRDYVDREFGQDWIVAAALRAGAVLHHGDIPQEVREVLEGLVRTRSVSLIICTNTLAEGVNLPLRTLILYSTRRRTPAGRAIDLLTRDIKNLVGRAGRPGSSTRGLVVCANEGQWAAVRAVAEQQVAEPVHGALNQLLINLQRALARQPIDLTNAVLEATRELHPLVDGIDSTLIDLVTEEIGEDELIQIARQVASQTFAFEQATPASSDLLTSVFSLRATRVVEAREQGRLGWIRSTGARLRHIDSVVGDLMGRLPNWEARNDPRDAEFIEAVLSWALSQSDVQASLRDAYRLARDEDTTAAEEAFGVLVRSWLDGERFVQIAARSQADVDDVVRIHASLLSYTLQTIVEQGLALLAMALAADNRAAGRAVRLFPEYLRHGVPGELARRLAAEGLRHRAAANQLGAALGRLGLDTDVDGPVGPSALGLLDEEPEQWQALLGPLVVENTRIDLARPLGAAGNTA
jgi:ATP-dependent DNA helicase